MLQQENVVLRAGSFCHGNGSYVKKEQEKLLRKIVWEVKKMVQNSTEDVTKGAPDV